MALWEMTELGLSEVRPTAFAAEAVLERRHLQRYFRDRIDALGDDLYVLSEEFDGWDDGRLRIDLLCIDRNARIVVVELKRDFADSDMQALRYAAMASSMTADQAILAHRQYIEARRTEATRPGGGQLPLSFPNATEAEAGICAFLGRSEFVAFGGVVRIVLASLGFTKAVTTTALWLLDQAIDIRCISLQPYRHSAVPGLLLNVQQVVPVPDAGDYQIRVAIRNKEERSEQAVARTRQSFWLRIGNEEQSSLGKGRLAFQAVRALVDKFGIAPDEISAQVTRRRLFVSIPGHLSVEEFNARLSDEARPWVGRCFVANDGDLIRAGDRTFAFTNQWGLDTEDFVRELAEKFFKPQGIPFDFGPESNTVQGT